VPVEDTVDVLVGVIVCVAAERVADGVFVPVTLGLPLTVPVLDPVGDGVPERLLDGEAVPVELTVPERLFDGEAVLVGLFEAAERVAVTVFVPETDGELDTVADPVTLTDPDGLPELEGLPEELGELVPDILCVGETVEETVEVPETVTEADALGVGVAGKQIAGKALSIGPEILKSSTI
jgi:hypothetical protein